jgi:hypothetical protein
LPLDRTTARHGLPHPLALLYDRLNQHDPRVKLAELLRFAEGTARFLAWVLVAEAAARGLPNRELRGYMKPGAGFGFFLHVIESAIHQRRARQDGFLRELDGFLQSPAWAALQAFHELRNAAAHHRLSTSTETARALLAEHRDAFQHLLDGIAFFTRRPLGVLRGTRVAFDGVVTAHWFACRGLSLHSGNLELADAAGLPSEQLLLIDPEARLALTLSPFFLCTEQAFCWLDLPAPGDAGQRSVYARPVSDDALPAGTPWGLVDATGASSNGLSLDAWLADSRQRGRFVPLRLDAPSLRAIVQSAAPTQVVEVQSSPAACVIAPEAPAASARERAAVMEPSTAPVPWLPTMLMSSLPVPIRSTESVDPVASERPAPAPVNLPRRVLPVIVGAAVGTLLAGTLLLTRARSDGSPSREPTALGISQASSAPGPGPLSSNPALQQWVQAWVPARDRLNDAMLSRYAGAVAFQGMAHHQDPNFILGRWRERLLAGTFTVDLSSSTWYETVETDANVSAACRNLPGADPGVTVVRLEADENGVPLGAALATGGCSRVTGTYLLRSRVLAGRRIICNETWHRETIRRSCPGSSNYEHGR